MADISVQSRTAEAIRENPMGTEPVHKILIQLSVPMMISMLVQAMYNVVDSIFVSRVGENALSAVSLAFPAQSLMISFAVGTGVGVNALLSKSLGEQNYQRANRTAGNGLLLAGITYLFFLVFGFVGVKPFLSAQTNDPEILEYGVQYLSVCAIFGFGMFGQCMGEKLLTGTGLSTYAMFSQLGGAITNIIMDPILIFGLFGAPRMEAKGAAVATVMGQMVGFAISMFFNLKRNHDIRLSLDEFKPNKKVIKHIYEVGAPSIAMQSVGSVMTFCLNKILIGFSSTAVAVFGGYFKLQSFVFMPVFGLNNGLVPLVSFNFGARKPKRMVQAIKLSIIYATGIMVIGFAIFQLFPGLLLEAFNAGPEMLAIGRPALRIISFSFLIAGFNVICSSSFQALGRGGLALVISVGRQLVALIPLAFLLSLTGNLDLVWLAFPMAEVISLLLVLIFLKKCYSGIVKPMLDEEEAAEAQK